MTKVLILAGGKGTRFSEKTIKQPKPLINIARRPLIWYIMKHYSNFNLKDFIVLSGYKHKLFNKEFKTEDFDEEQNHVPPVQEKKYNQKSIIYS